eukprot:3458613-Pleurochrysis_carterae.AAC.2
MRDEYRHHYVLPFVSTGMLTAATTCRNEMKRRKAESRRNFRQAAVWRCATGRTREARLEPIEVRDVLQRSSTPSLSIEGPSGYTAALRHPRDPPINFSKRSFYPHDDCRHTTRVSVSNASACLIASRSAGVSRKSLCCPSGGRRRPWIARSAQPAACNACTRAEVRAQARACGRGR